MKTQLIIVAGAAFIGAIIMTSIPRSVRNNNPLNIRKTNDQWEGQSPVSQDDAFVTFLNPAYGFRAAAKLMTNYKNKYGLNTIEQIVTRWAPPSENDTASYIRQVSKRVGKAPGEPLNFEQDLPKLLAAMAHHEGGGDFYAEPIIKLGVSLA